MSRITVSGADASRRSLAAEIDRVTAMLTGDPAPPPTPMASAADDGAGASRIADLVERLSLGPFERDLLLVALGIEIDPRLAQLAPSFDVAVAFERLAGGHWSALAPDGALRHWRLIMPEGGGPLLRMALRIDEDVLHWLTGASDTASSVVRDALPIADTGPLPVSHAATVATIAARLRAGLPNPAIELVDGVLSDRLAIARAAAAAVGLETRIVDREALAARGWREAVRFWERELLLTGMLPTVDPGDAADPNARAFVEAFGGPLILVAPVGSTQRGTLPVALPRVGFDERLPLWAEALALPADTAGLARLAWQFNLAPAEIALVGAEACRADGDDRLGAAWGQARVRSRRDAGPLARRSRPATTLDDLVLPEAQRRTLEAVASQARHQATVHGAWGMGGGARGLGIAALFSGPSGAGKTTAAEAVANELGLDLLHVDLSQVASKYIGETEKNLDRVFDAAEGGGAVLLFDEADALFGKRSEVKDSHDRYANLEISYLLQRMEAYCGLAILTTNQKSAIDAAFLRRIRFVVHFPFPDRALRRELWQRALPEPLLAEPPDWAELSRLSLTGGSIRNVAISAAFHAAADGKPIDRDHLLRAVAAEGAKIETPQLVLQMARERRQG